MVLVTLIGVAGCGSLGSTLPTGCTKSTTVSLGDTVRTSFGTNSCVESDGTYVDFYDITSRAQATLRITLASPGLTTYVRVFDSNHTTVVNSALQQTPDTSVTVRALLPAGDYQIAVRATVPGASAAYRLVAAPDTAPIAGCGNVLWAATGIETTQNLTSTDCAQGSGGSTRYYDVYTIVLLLHQGTTFTEKSTAFTPAMILNSALGGTQNSTLDSTGTVATIPGFALANDAYKLWVGSANPLQTGAYTLTIK